ncbi:hypothetical protein RCL1_006779 [Eukaryota sp. TZLM3-RCL]
MLPKTHFFVLALCLGLASAFYNVANIRIENQLKLPLRFADSTAANNCFFSPGPSPIIYSHQVTFVTVICQNHIKAADSMFQYVMINETNIEHNANEGQVIIAVRSTHSVLVSSSGDIKTSVDIRPEPKNTFVEVVIAPASYVSLHSSQQTLKKAIFEVKNSLAEVIQIIDPVGLDIRSNVELAPNKVLKSSIIEDRSSVKMVTLAALYDLSARVDEFNNSWLVYAGPRSCPKTRQWVTSGVCVTEESVLFPFEISGFVPGFDHCLAYQ